MFVLVCWSRDVHEKRSHSSRPTCSMLAESFPLSLHRSLTKRQPTKHPCLEELFLEGGPIWKPYVVLAFSEEYDDNLGCVDRECCFDFWAICFIITVVITISISTPPREIILPPPSRVPFGSEIPDRDKKNLVNKQLNYVGGQDMGLP
jgi:hypothetical protein